MPTRSYEDTLVGTATICPSLDRTVGCRKAGPLELTQQRILFVRGKRVLLDADLARLF
jgi:hypothetical protein